MDPVSLASALVAAQTGQIQMAVAVKMMKMNADNQAAVVQLLSAGQANVDKLADVAAGIGTSLDVSA
jgi:hypothetical protein